MEEIKSLNLNYFEELNKNKNLYKIINNYENEIYEYNIKIEDLNSKNDKLLNNKLTDNNIKDDSFNNTNLNISEIDQLNFLDNLNSSDLKIEKIKELLLTISPIVTNLENKFLYSLPQYLLKFINNNIQELNYEEWLENPIVKEISTFENSDLILKKKEADTINFNINIDFDNKSEKYNEILEKLKSFNTKITKDIDNNYLNF